MHIINIVVCLLMQSSISPINEFKTWAAMPNKTYPGLKTVIHEAYTRRLTAISLHNTAGSIGYVGNNANAFTIINPLIGEDTNDDDITTVTQTAAAATTGSTLGKAYEATRTSASFPVEVAAAIQQLLANQVLMVECDGIIAKHHPDIECKLEKLTYVQRHARHHCLWYFSLQGVDIKSGVQLDVGLKLYGISPEWFQRPSADHLLSSSLFQLIAISAAFCQWEYGSVCLMQQSASWHFCLNLLTVCSVDPSMIILGGTLSC
jgi:hypothetical protein